MSAWACFWLVVAVFIVCEAVIFLKGYDTLLWERKTATEKSLLNTEEKS
jgi:hypothetical protein